MSGMFEDSRQDQLEQLQALPVSGEAEQHHQLMLPVLMRLL